MKRKHAKIDGMNCREYDQFVSDLLQHGCKPDARARRLWATYENSSDSRRELLERSVAGACQGALILRDTLRQRRLKKQFGWASAGERVNAYARLQCVRMLLEIGGTSGTYYGLKVSEPGQ